MRWDLFITALVNLSELGLSESLMYIYPKAPFTK